jgi:hypothetical protein
LTTSIILAYYYDSNAKDKLQQDDNNNWILDFGKEYVDNPPVAGQSSAYKSIYVRNEHPDRSAVELTAAQTNDTDLKIILYPQFLQWGQMAGVVIVFQPSADRTEDVSNINWGFDMVVYPNK